MNATPGRQDKILQMTDYIHNLKDQPNSDVDDGGQASNDVEVWQFRPAIVKIGIGRIQTWLLLQTAVNLEIPHALAEGTALDRSIISRCLMISLDA